MQHPVLQLRHRLAIEMQQRRLQAPLERGLRITAKVEVVLVVNGLDQQALLDVQGGGFAVWHGGFGKRYLGIQTRTSDSNFSTSSGLAM